MILEAPGEVLQGCPNSGRGYMELGRVVECELVLGSLCSGRSEAFHNLLQMISWRKSCEAKHDEERNI